MKNVCMDSTLIIDFLRGKSAAIEQIADVTRETFPCTTSINVFEVMHGLLRRKDNKAMEVAEAFFNSCPVINMDPRAAKKAAAIAAELENKGMMINVLDTLIAGAMLTNGCQTIVTANKSDFQRIKDIAIY
ncbi:type II toxin-antitoxin system VapC family toxin [Candidatus Woesearchaeota archaeon]|nr:type II toxin-antitoxin system VapC family toxin [Candidatus Woesearchaeota archaeon]